jgi:hypothetical protein
VLAYLHGESLDGAILQELGEVIPITRLPPLSPPLVLAWTVRVFGVVFREYPMKGAANTPENSTEKRQRERTGPC